MPSDEKILIKQDNPRFAVEKEADGKLKITAFQIDGGKDKVLVGQRLDIRLQDGMIVVARSPIPDEPSAPSIAPDSSNWPPLSTYTTDELRAELARREGV